MIDKDKGEGNKDSTEKTKNSGIRATTEIASDTRNLIFENRIKCEWLSTKEAAHFLSITENAVRILVHRGQIPAFKFGRRLRFKHSDCQALFQKKGA